MKGYHLIFTVTFFVTLSLLSISNPKKQSVLIQQNRFNQISSNELKEEIVNPNISIKTPGFLEYSDIITQFKKWENEAESLVDVDYYGTTSDNTKICFAKITNENNVNIKKKVLITGAIHGDEPLSTSILMGYVGRLLTEYGDDVSINEMLNNREIYIIPVISPDSYPNQRESEGYDPNRDFNNENCKIIKEIKRFVTEQSFDAIISTHCFGKVMLIPWGNKRDLCNHHEIYKEITSKMQKVNNYDVIRGCQMYNELIYGSELDWYYSKGIFAIVIEFSTTRNKISIREIEQEVNQNYNAINIFVLEGAEVEI